MASTRMSKPEVHAEVAITLVNPVAYQASCERRQLRPGGIKSPPVPDRQVSVLPDPGIDSHRLAVRPRFGLTR